MAVKKELELNIEPKIEVKPEITISTTSAKKSDKVDILPAKDFSVYYGDRWYYFKEGTKVKVSQELKNYLIKQGALAVI